MNNCCTGNALLSKQIKVGMIVYKVFRTSCNESLDTMCKLDTRKGVTLKISNLAHDLSIPRYYLAFLAMMAVATFGGTSA